MKETLWFQDSTVMQQRSKALSCRERQRKALNSYRVEDYYEVRRYLKTWWVMQWGDMKILLQTVKPIWSPIPHIKLIMIHHLASRYSGSPRCCCGPVHWATTPSCGGILKYFQMCLVCFKDNFLFTRFHVVLWSPIIFSMYLMVILLVCEKYACKLGITDHGMNNAHPAKFVQGHNIPNIWRKCFMHRLNHNKSSLPQKFLVSVR